MQRRPWNNTSLPGESGAPVCMGLAGGILGGIAAAIAILGISGIVDNFAEMLE